MLTDTIKINILGTDVTVEFRKESDDSKLAELSGYYDCTVALIVVKVYEPDPLCVSDLERLQKETLRHEILHAFLYESGVQNCSASCDAWATNEEMVDWFAIQAPKIFKIFNEQGLI